MLRGGWALCALLLAVGPLHVLGNAQAISNYLGNATTPNIILISMDGAMVEEAWTSGYYDFLTLISARNPNGCRVPMTWFVSKQGKDLGTCEVVQRAHAYGHELATHSVMHAEEVLSYTYEEMKADIGGMKDFIAGECGIPTEEVLGYRGPRFYVNDFTGQALAELGFLYDSSLPDVDPQTLPGRWNETELVCNRPTRTCPAWKNYGLWELPVYRLPGEDKRTDPMPSEGMTIYQRLENDFNRKRGYGTPVIFATHDNYFDNSTAVAEVVEFMDWALEQPDTWALTYTQYIKWLMVKDDGETTIESIVEEYPCDTREL